MCFDVVCDEFSDCVWDDFYVVFFCFCCCSRPTPLTYVSGVRYPFLLELPHIHGVCPQIHDREVCVDFEYIIWCVCFCCQTQGTDSSMGVSVQASICHDIFYFCEEQSQPSSGQTASLSKKRNRIPISGGQESVDTICAIFCSPTSYMLYRFVFQQTFSLLLARILHFLLRVLVFL